MATADEYAAWIVKNADKKGTPEFETVAAAYQAAKAPAEQGYLESAAAGLGSGVGRVALGAQHYLGKALGAVGADAAGNYLVNDAAQGRTKLAAEMAPYKAANPMTAGGGELVGEIAATWPVGGVIANVASRVLPAAVTAAPAVAKGLQAVRTGGFSLGAPAATTLAGKAVDVGLRAAGGAVAGGAQAGLINPDEAGLGALVGGVLPVGVQALGKVAGVAGDLYGKAKPKPVNALREALGLPEDVFAEMVRQAKAGASGFVDGSNLTLAQALQKQGASSSQVKILEKLVAQGPGGARLADQYAAQEAARLQALKNQGAETYQGAAMSEKTAKGDLLAAILRTQAADDRQAARVAWQGSDGLGGVYGRAAQDGVQLQLPLSQMQDAMRPLGAGSVLPGTDARRVLQVANEIGTEVLPGVAPLRAGPVLQSQNLEQAVRAAGGIRMGGAGLGGELRDLGIRQSGTTGLINNQSGRPADLLAEQMYNRGFIPDADPATLLDALRNGGGRRLFANDAVENNAAQRMAEAAMGDAPEAERIARAVPFDEFQRLRRDSGNLAAKVGERAGGETEAGVLAEIQRLLTQRADDAANGAILAGDNLSPEFLAQYNQARALTQANAERYKGGNNITSILRKPVGQDYTLTGDEVMNKLWHGGAGLSGDVSNLKNVLNDSNQQPALNALRKFILTDAASKTTASGNFGAALPKYVESRLPGLEEALTPAQLQALSAVAADIRNAEAASALAGAAGKGSDTYQKIANALDAGVLDGPLAKSVAKMLTFKGVGAEGMRTWAANAAKASRGGDLAELLANPAALEQALVAGGPQANALLEMLSKMRSVNGQAVGSVGQGAQRLLIPALVD